jgi:hypothetical protein
MADATKAETTLANLSKLLKRLNEDTQILRKAGNLDALSKELPPIEYAKVCASMGYTINSLYKGSVLSA